MKKTLALIMALAMVFALSVPAFADNGFADGSSTDVTYAVSESYVVTIPADQTYGESGFTGGSVSATNVVIDAAKKLVVTIASANGYRLELGGDSDTYYAVYTVSDGTTTFSGAEANDVLTVAAGTASGETTLTFALGDLTNATCSGEYKDTLTFACSLEDVTPST